MNRSSVLPWLFLAVWATWLSAWTGYGAQFAAPGRWMPDLALALFVSLAARANPGDIAKFAACFGVARAAVSIDAPAAVLASALVAGALLRLARSAIQVDHPVIRALLACALCIGQSAWLELVHARVEGAPFGGELAWRAGVATALVAASLGSALVHLPGLGNLLRRKAWAVGASLR